MGTDDGTGSRKRFTGHERDAATGMDYMLARYLSLTTASFASVDPISGAPSEPQSWNSYAYVRGNPIAATDPKGAKDEYKIPVVAAAMVNLYDNYQTKEMMEHGFVALRPEGGAATIHYAQPEDRGIPTRKTRPYPDLNSVNLPAIFDRSPELWSQEYLGAAHTHNARFESPVDCHDPECGVGESTHDTEFFSRMNGRFGLSGQKAADSYFITQSGNVYRWIFEGESTRVISEYVTTIDVLRAIAMERMKKQGNERRARKKKDFDFQKEGKDEE
jgi:RHS repeat-associated protein